MTVVIFVLGLCGLGGIFVYITARFVAMCFDEFSAYLNGED